VAADGIAGPITYGAVFRHMGAVAHAQFGAAMARHVGNIADTQLRLAHWLGQMAHESGGFRHLTESMTYSSATRIRAVWPSRFPTLASAQLFIRNPEALAERVYGGRMGNTHPGDGFRFRGRGIIHITGRANYATYGEAIGVNLLNHPERAAEPGIAVQIAVAYWQRNGLNAVADRNDIRELTRRINGGFNGMQDRIDRTERARSLLA
jgi:putative chitinase